MALDFSYDKEEFFSPTSPAYSPTAPVNRPTVPASHRVRRSSGKNVSEVAKTIEYSSLKSGFLDKEPSSDDGYKGVLVFLVAILVDEE